MSANSSLCPKIDVLYWDASNVYIECPYCEERHCHGMVLPGRRLSHCNTGQYEFILPIDESSELVGYEIDKRRARFVNVGLRTVQGDETLHSPEQYECELDDRFRSAMNISVAERNSAPALNLYEDSRELETIVISDDDTFEEKRILFAISECICGNLHTIGQYLSTSAEKKLFLTGKNKNGDTTLIMAAAEKNHEMVSFLLQNGADANAINNNGRTALMEAALWGRIENIKVLLSANANKHLKDHEGRCAMDLAQPTRKNEKERYWRSSLAAADRVPERDRDRRHIVILLRDPVDAKEQHKYTGPLSESECNKYRFRKSGSEMAITFYGPICSYRVPYITKTAAVLDRGDQFARISATSGWAPGALPPDDRSRLRWIEQVYCIASIYFASHAEKKLIAYFIDRHVFMPQDTEPDQKLERSILKAEASLEEGKHLFLAWAKVCDLEEKRGELNRRLFDADDQLLGDCYDEQEVETLKHEIDAINEQLSTLELDANVAAMRATEKEIGILSKRNEMHQRLMELSRHQPRISLKQAVILSSNKICDDCDMFKRKVNSYFQLEIDMNWRT
ncbi:hypothetical protein COCMIDRAFT_40654 [Bipolaris oryzae ATCC 44560]|uniref:Uncharacterized protein n=1 Tax=Bipolaris oryzae ATCC 44560 TaxID=930090 RepID=W6Z039_COCMI|nr:uncharacterized protein COCMIDRAFT_40654 [Bipolaris oryzae ATCC 44560]EUC41139.1 hypothetical protein COCMIDRAFT_40654 [Bipolaris oryzae ATCC 44560]